MLFDKISLIMKTIVKKSGVEAIDRKSCADRYVKFQD